MFSSLIASGLCNVQRCNPVVYDDYLCNSKASKKEKFSEDTQGSKVYTSEVSERTDHLISRTEIEATLSRQHRIEERMEQKTCGKFDHSFRQSISFADSTLSSSDSVTTKDSTYYSVFSATTQITGHTNKYGIPTGTPPSSPRRHTKSRLNVDHKDRYAAHVSGRNDWDYTVGVEMENDKDAMIDTPKSVFVLHLKMRATMSDFYREEFLLSFPHFPVPTEMDMRVAEFQRNWGTSKSRSPKRSQHNIPGLIKSASSVSSVSDQDSPLQPADIPVFLAVDGSSFLNLAISGCLGLVDSRSRKNSLPSRDPNKEYLIIGNRQSGIPMLVCSLKSRKGKPVIRLFATKPRIPEQQPTIESDELCITEDPIPLYTWAELRTVNEYPDMNTKYLLYMSTGMKNKFHKKPLYTACHEYEGSTELNVLRRKEGCDGKGPGINDETKSDLFHCARVCVRTDSNICNQETNYMMSIVKDVEFADILAMTAIIDELIEFAMRKKCAMQAWKFAAMEAAS